MTYWSRLALLWLFVAVAELVLLSRVEFIAAGSPSGGWAVGLHGSLELLSAIAVLGAAIVITWRMSSNGRDGDEKANDRTT